MLMAAVYTVGSSVHFIPSYTGQTGFAILMDKDLFITMSFARAGAIETNFHASLGARLQK